MILKESTGTRVTYHFPHDPLCCPDSFLEKVVVTDHLGLGAEAAAELAFRHPKRWHDHTCTRCKTRLTAGAETFVLRADSYQPMQPGPSWEATGDWQPAPIGIMAGTLCRPCIDDVRRFAFGYLPNGREQ